MIRFSLPESMRELAAVTDAELVADILSAVAEVLACGEEWRRASCLSGRELDRHGYAALQAARTAVAALPESAELRAVVTA
jgi:hypothetical protein